MLASGKTNATPAALLAAHDRVFTAAIKHQIAQAIPVLLFANAQGVMLDDGAVWFRADGKIKALNP